MKQVDDAFRARGIDAKCLVRFGGPVALFEVQDRVRFVSLLLYANTSFGGDAEYINAGNVQTSYNPPHAINPAAAHHCPPPPPPQTLPPPVCWHIVGMRCRETTGILEGLAGA